jgi:hypothetical protein
MLRPADLIRQARKNNTRKATSTMASPSRSKATKPWRTLVAHKMVGVRILRNLMGPGGNQPTFGLGIANYDRGPATSRVRRAG